MSPATTTADFSPHLFWDTSPGSVDLGSHRNWLVKRVLEKGTRADWEMLLSVYGRPGVREAVQELPSLEKKATSFACAVLDLDQSRLRCFTNRLSHKSHWSY